MKTFCLMARVAAFFSIAVAVAAPPDLPYPTPEQAERACAVEREAVKAVADGEHEKALRLIDDAIEAWGGADRTDLSYVRGNQFFKARILKDMERYDEAMDALLCFRRPSPYADFGRDPASDAHGFALLGNLYMLYGSAYQQQSAFTTSKNNNGNTVYKTLGVDGEPQVVALELHSGTIITVPEDTPTTLEELEKKYAGSGISDSSSQPDDEGPGSPLEDAKIFYSLACDAFRSAKRCEEMIERGDKRFRTMNLGATNISLGMAQLAAGDFASARESLTEGKSLFVAAGAAHGVQMATCLNGFARIDEQHGKFQDALPKLEQMLEMYQSELDSDNPYVLATKLRISAAKAAITGAASEACHVQELQAALNSTELSAEELWIAGVDGVPASLTEVAKAQVAKPDFNTTPIAIRRTNGQRSEAGYPTSSHPASAGVHGDQGVNATDGGSVGDVEDAQGAVFTLPVIGREYPEGSQETQATDRGTLGFLMTVVAGCLGCLCCMIVVRLFLGDMPTVHIWVLLWILITMLWMGVFSVLSWDVDVIPAPRIDPAVGLGYGAAHINILIAAFLIAFGFTLEVDTFEFPHWSVRFLVTCSLAGVIAASCLLIFAPRIYVLLLTNLGMPVSPPTAFSRIAMNGLAFGAATSSAALTVLLAVTLVLSEVLSHLTRGLLGCVKH